jgi:curved DNA-binding protein CbpA
MATVSPPKYKDYYELLGLLRDEELTPEKIKKAFMSKAMLWHPDKAPTNEDIPVFTKVYEDLQQAYKILSNEESRRQYSTSQQTTNLELVRGERDLSYDRSEQYSVRTELGTGFDRDRFIRDFEQTRSKDDRKIMDEFLSKTSPVSKSDYDRFVAERDRDLQIDNIFGGAQGGFNSNLFNQAFEYVKKNNPSRGIEEYIEPQAMGLAELDQGFSGVDFNSVMFFTNGSYQGVDVGVGLNPSTLDLGMFTTEKQVEAKLSAKELEHKLREMQEDRTRLSKLNEADFKVVPSDIEKLYPHLFVSSIEELEAKRSDTQNEHKLACSH